MRDYLCIQLGGSRGTEAQTYRNLLETMLLGRLWHGANWTFVVWGAIHGIGLSLERFIFGHRTEHVEPHGWRKWLRWVITFHAVCLAWVFFRADSVTAALRMLGQLGHFAWTSDYAAAWLFLGLLGGLGLLIDLKLERSGSEYLFANDSTGLRIGAVATAMVLLMLFAASEGNAFIYFQF